MGGFKARNRRAKAEKMSETREAADVVVADGNKHVACNECGFSKTGKNE